MPFDYSTLIRPDVRAAAPAQWPLALEAVAERLGMSVHDLAKLDTNENLYGPSPKVGEAIARFDRLQFYPDAQYARLRAALARHSATPVDRIVLSNGLDEMIDLLTRSLIVPGEAVMDCPPSFEVYAWAADINHARTVRVPDGTVPRWLQIAFHMPKVSQPTQKSNDVLGASSARKATATISITTAR